LFETLKWLKSSRLTAGQKEATRMVRIPPLWLLNSISSVLVEELYICDVQSWNSQKIIY